MGMGKQVRKYRVDAGLTLAELSELSTVDVGTISALEQRDSERSRFFPLIARALGLTVEQLMNPALEAQLVVTRDPRTQKVHSVRRVEADGSLAPVDDEPLLVKYGQVLADLEAIPVPWRNRLLDRISDEADLAREAAAHHGTLQAIPHHGNPQLVEPAPTGALDPDATAAKLQADDQRLDELARRKRGERLK